MYLYFRLVLLLYLSIELLVSVFSMDLFMYNITAYNNTGSMIGRFALDAGRGYVIVGWVDVGPLAKGRKHDALNASFTQWRTSKGPPRERMHTMIKAPTSL